MSLQSQTNFQVPIKCPYLQPSTWQRVLSESFLRSPGSPRPFSQPRPVCPSVGWLPLQVQMLIMPLAQPSILCLSWSPAQPSLPSWCLVTALHPNPLWSQLSLRAQGTDLRPSFCVVAPTPPPAPTPEDWHLWQPGYDKHVFLNTTCQDDAEESTGAVKVSSESHAQKQGKGPMCSFLWPLACHLCPPPLLCPVNLALAGGTPG